MIRTVSDLLSQQNLPQVRRLKCAIIDVLFPSRSFVVLRAGYGRQVVPADSNIDFGTYGRPLVASGNFVWIELNESDGTWHATKYEANATCTPTTLPNAPNVPLTTYKPPQNTAITFEPFRVDTNFFPHVASIGLLAPASKSPAQTIPGVGAKLVYQGLGNTTGNQPLFDIKAGRMYVGTGSKIRIFDLGDPRAPTFISDNYTTAATPYSIRVVGNYIYLIDWNSGGGSGFFRILDAADPYHIIQSYSLALPSNTLVRTFDVFTAGDISGQTVYVTWSTFSPDNTYVYSVTYPTGPLVLLATIADAHTVAPYGGGQFAPGFCVCVVERITTPMFKLYYNNGLNLRGSVALTGVNPIYVVGTNTTQSRAANQFPESVWYIADPNTGLITIVDASNAAAPAVAGTIPGDSVLQPGIATNSYSITALLVYGGYLFVGASWFDAVGGVNAGVLTMFDLSNKLVPRQVSRDQAGAWNVTDYPAGMRGYGPYVYCVSGATGATFVYSFT